MQTSLGMLAYRSVVLMQRWFDGGKKSDTFLYIKAIDRAHRRTWNHLLLVNLIGQEG